MACPCCKYRKAGSKRLQRRYKVGDYAIESVFQCFRMRATAVSGKPRAVFSVSVSVGEYKPGGASIGLLQSLSRICVV